MNRQSWSFEEDEAITKLVIQHGFNDWTQIAKMLKENYDITKRTGKQCRERWYNHLNPAVNKKPWGNEEEERLFQLHKIHGNRWKDISRQFVGRTDNDIKNHFYSTLRRSLRRLNKILGQKNSTSQMRVIKPSVLSTIMNYLYEQEVGIENDLLISLKDLPSLIFEFANFKPVKTNLKFTKVQDAKIKVSEIFQLINRFNEEYEKTKIQRQTSKLIKRSVSSKEPIQRQFTTESFTLQKEALGEASGSNSMPLTNKTTPQIKNTDCSLPGSSEDFDLNNEQIVQKKQSSLKSLQEQECSQEEEVGKLKSRHRNMSLDDDEMALLEMKDPQEPSVISQTNGGLDLTIVGHHWEPQSWQRQAEMKEFVDEVLEINYEQINHEEWMNNDFM